MEILLSFAAFAAFFTVMALGLLFQGKPLKGSCGGVANLMGDEKCGFCGGDPNKCEESQTSSETGNTDLAYDAGKKTQ